MNEGCRAVDLAAVLAAVHWRISLSIPVPRVECGMCYHNGQCGLTTMGGPEFLNVLNGSRGMSALVMIGAWDGTDVVISDWPALRRACGR